jgi:hypothetical protein
MFSKEIHVTPIDLKNLKKDFGWSFYQPEIDSYWSVLLNTDSYIEENTGNKYILSIQVLEPMRQKILELHKTDKAEDEIEALGIIFKVKVHDSRFLREGKKIYKFEGFIEKLPPHALSFYPIPSDRMITEENEKIDRRSGSKVLDNFMSESDVEGKTIIE